MVLSDATEGGYGLNYPTELCECTCPIEIQANQLKGLYLKGMTSKELSKYYGCSARTILIRLHRLGVPVRPSGMRRLGLGAGKLQELYVKRGLSTWKIASSLGCGRSHVYRLLKKYHVPIRTRAESHIRYPRRSFSRNSLEKAYLIGFRLGDLRVRRGNYAGSETIFVDCGSTKQEQLELIRSLFVKYGHVWVGRPDALGRQHIQASLNRSFDFLLSPRVSDPLFRGAVFGAFLSGFVDADGSITFSKGRPTFVLQNYNLFLLRKIRAALLRLGFSPTRVKRYTTRYFPSSKYPRRGDYCSVSVSRRNSLLALLRFLEPHVRHKKRRRDLLKALRILQRNRRRPFKHTAAP